ncbi:23S rRNA (uracil(747)-C(5))-methyltransferase [uncultured archaeon]|nr:23S rRNA (uracil(747)-C(5))-methyltransferase [uncultured archaeon]
MQSLSNDTKKYFAAEKTVSKWWNPTEGTYRFHYEKELQVLNEQFPVNKDWKILDVGTGKGRFAIYFAKNGCKVTALDISEEMLDIARQNAKKEGVADKITFVLGDAEDLSNIKQKYDAVCCMEALDHIPDVEKALSKMSAKIRLGGYFLFTYVPETSLYWKLYYNLFIGKKIGIARAYPDNYAAELFKKNDIAIKKLFGIGVVFPTGPKVLKIPLYALARLEKLIKPYYRNPSFIRRCTHVIGWGTKEN